VGRPHPHRTDDACWISPSCAAARLAIHARMSCRVARPLGVVPQRVQPTRTSPNHSSTATYAGAAQVRHHRCPVKATTCTGEDTHWCNQRWCRRQLIRSNGSRPDSSATSSAARRAVSGAALLSACRGRAGFGVAASGDKCGDALEGGGQRVDACHVGGDGVRVPTRSQGSDVVPVGKRSKRVGSAGSGSIACRASTGRGWRARASGLLGALIDDPAPIRLDRLGDDPLCQPGLRHPAPGNQ